MRRPTGVLRSGGERNRRGWDTVRGLQEEDEEVAEIFSG